MHRVWLLQVITLCVCLYGITACRHRSDRGDRLDRHGRRGGCRGGRCGQHHLEPSLGRWACRLVDAASKDIIFERTCGCPGETQVTCDLGPLAVTGVHGEKLEVTFCNVYPNYADTFNPWRGAMCEACSIEKASQDGAVYDTQACPDYWSCDLGPLPLTVNGTSSEAFFCSPTYSDIDVLNWDNQCSCRRGYYDHSCVRLQCCGGEYGSCYQGDSWGGHMMGSDYYGRHGRYGHHHDYDGGYPSRRRSYDDDDDDDDDDRRRSDYDRQYGSYGRRGYRRG